MSTENKWVVQVAVRKYRNTRGKRKRRVVNPPKNLNLSFAVDQEMMDKVVLLATKADRTLSNTLRILVSAALKSKFVP